MEKNQDKDRALDGKKNMACNKNRFNTSCNTEDQRRRSRELILLG